MSAGRPTPGGVVIDTNIALDLLVFNDPTVQPLRDRLDRGRLVWLATVAMRDELARVLGYERLHRRTTAAGLAAGEVLAAFDALTRLVATPLPAGIACRDGDDQKFVDLAVACSCLLLSKDRDLLSLKTRLAALGVAAARALTAHNDPSSHHGSAP